MTRTRLLATRLALALGATLLGANYLAAQKVATNYDNAVDFSKFKTYKWVDIQGATYPNQLQDMQIRNAIDSTLKMKGFTKVDSDSANVYVGYQLSISQQKEWNAYNTGGGAWGWGGMGGMGGMGTMTATSSTIQDGTLAIDIYDPSIKQLVWQSTATKQLNPGSNQAKNLANLQKAVNKMFQKYPPQPKKGN
ncbi:MAG TPA: DUF4136 domain-containing protein [Gemmatimonadales bacterium]|nr:DUF4136 domain-containing protein [Gemmatimonadales bacterium]